MLLRRAGLAPGSGRLTGRGRRCHHRSPAAAAPSSAVVGGRTGQEEEQQQQQQQRESPSSAAAPRQGCRNVVVAIDTSEGSFKAVQWTLKNLYREGDVLHLLHVVPSASSVQPAFGGIAPVMPQEEGLQEQVAAHMAKFIEQHYMKLAIEYGAQCQVDLVHGKGNQAVSAAICAKCEDLAAAVVVLSMQKQGWWDGLFQVPVSQQVADSCSRPTLIYHCDDTMCAPMT